MACRDRHYEVTSLNQLGSDFIFVDNSKPELSLMTNDDVNIGIHIHHRSSLLAKMQVKLAPNYHGIQ